MNGWSDTSATWKCRLLARGRGRTRVDAGAVVRYPRTVRSLPTEREEAMMAKGRCLCGALTYELDGPFSAMVHCHCSMCRKHHGTGFATFIAAPIAGFRWISSQDSLLRYQSSPKGMRTFCRVCGSRSIASPL